MHGIQCDIFLLKNGAIYCLTSFPYKSVYVHTRETASVKPKTYRIEVMNKKVTKTPTQKQPAGNSDGLFIWVIFFLLASGVPFLS